MTKLNNFFIKKIYQFPTKYIELVNVNCEKYNVSKPLVLAIIKTESNFNEQAVSSKGAIGLMQITPQTFTWLQKLKNNKIIESKEKLFKSDTNIKYGVYLLSYLLSKFKNETLAICAYNAGIGAVNSWLKQKKLNKNSSEIEKIPYKETKLYIEKVRRAKKAYKKIYYS